MTAVDEQYEQEAQSLREDHVARLEQLKKLRDLYHEMVGAEDARFNTEWVRAQLRASARVLEKRQP